jgi:hypothetical protein
LFAANVKYKPAIIKAKKKQIRILVECFQQIDFFYEEGTEEK